MPPLPRTGDSDFERSVFDEGVALARLGGNRELFRKLIHFYFDDAPALLEQLRTAAVHGEITKIERAAHTLKSLAANFEAVAATRAALRVEELAQGRNLGAAIECIPELERELRQLDRALTRYAEDSTG